MGRKIKGVGPIGAKVMIVGEAPGEEDIKIGKPFVGASGGFVEQWLRSIGVRRQDCYLTHVMKYRPYGGDVMSCVAKARKDITPAHTEINGWQVDGNLAEGVQELYAEIERIHPNIIVAMGNVALWALTGNSGIAQWRGSLCSFRGIKVIPVMHPIAVQRQYEWNPITVQDFYRVKKEMDSPDFPIVRENFLAEPTYPEAIERLQHYLSTLDHEPLSLSVDIETKAGEIDCIGIATSSADAVCIPFMTSDLHDPHYWEEDEETEIMWLLYQILSHPNAYIIGQNYAYDATFIRRKWLYWSRLDWDTMLAHHSILPSGGAILSETDKSKKGNAGAVKKNLGFLSSLYCKVHIYWKEEIHSERDHDRWVYNCRDTTRTYEIATREKEIIQQRRGKQAEVTGFQQSLFWPVRRMEERGFRVDIDTRESLAKELQEGITARQQWLEEILGHPFNLDSAPQMKALFYTDFGLTPIKKRHGKTMSVTCDDGALTTLAEKEPLILPIVTAIQEIRSLGVFLHTFLRAELTPYGRLCTSFDISGTKTFRFSHSANQFGEGTNLGNVPKGGPIHADNPNSLNMPNLRSLCIPDEGKMIFDTDFSSADLRTVAWESDEDELRAMFDAGLKPYVEVGKEYYHNPEFNSHSPEYKTFKSLCHGTNYLGSAREMAKRLGLLMHELERIQNWYFGKFPKIRTWQQRIKHQIEAKRYVENAFGNRCYFLGRITEKVFKEGVAWIPQSTVANAIDRVLVNIDRDIPEVELLDQVHDSLVGEFDAELESVVIPRILQAGKIIIPYPKPLIIPMEVKTSAKSWGDCE